MRKNESEPKSRMNKRALTSLSMFFSFIWLVPSGVTIHFAAEGPTEPLYHIAMSVHWAAALTFLSAIIFHSVLNWKPLTHHMMSKTKECLAFSGEALIALLIVTALILLVASHALFL